MCQLGGTLTVDLKRDMIHSLVLEKVYNLYEAKGS